MAIRLGIERREIRMKRGAGQRPASLGMVPAKVSLPDFPYDSLSLILFAEAAAAFEELTLAGGLKELKAQVPDAWPSLFRLARFLAAVDFVQADRFRRSVAQEMARILIPGGSVARPVAGGRDTHPYQLHRPSVAHSSRRFCGSLGGSQRLGAGPSRSPAAQILASPPRTHGITLIGRLFDEGTIGRAGLALERALNVAGRHPPGFRQ